MSGADTTTADTTTAGWVRRQRWWLVALAVLLPISIVYGLWPRWLDSQSELPWFVRGVDASATVEYGGASWRIAEWEVLDEFAAEQQRVELPEGTRLVAALIEVTPATGEPAPGVCRFELVDPGTDRRWTSGYDLVDLPGGVNAETNCDGEALGRYSVLRTWVVPTDAAESARLEILVLEIGPSRVQFIR